MTTRYNNVVEVDIPVKAVVNITLTGFVSYRLLIYDRRYHNDSANKCIRFQKFS